MTNHVSHHRPSVRACALAALAAVALAACEPEPGTGPTAETDAGATAQAQQNAATVAGDTRIRMSDCPTPAEGRVHFRVGEAVLAVPAGSVRDAIPVNMQPPLQQEEVAREVRAQVAAGAGCPGKPLETVLLLLNEDLGNPLLEGNIGILRSPPGQITEQFAKLTRDLQRQPTENCKPLSGDLLACVGTETLGQRETPVMYVITTDRSRNLNTGGPLAARCVLDGDAIQGCNLVDQLPGEMTVDATLNAGTYSTESLASAHQAVLSRIQTLRR